MAPIGVVDDRFELAALAGKGGMGEVYRAIDRHSGQPVAVKILHERGTVLETERFLQEARLLAELSHPSIVRYVDHGLTPDERPYLAMVWLDGEDLADRLLRQPLDPFETWQMARQAAAGLAFAHQHGVVHRDVKPRNLFLVARDPTQLRLLDFGVAKLAGDDRALTSTGAIVGTVEYMAPEQAEGERQLDARADVFALGCVLYRCLAGEEAFRGDSFVAVLAKLLLDEPRPLREVCPELPTRLYTLVDRMLDKAPERRPADGAAVLAELERIDIVRPASLIPERAAAPDANTAVGGALVDAFGPTVARERALRAPALTETEQRFVSVMLARGAGPPLGDAAEDAIGDIVRRLGGRSSSLADGTWLVSVTGRGSATDRAARVARCALALQDAIADVQVVIATDLAEETGASWVGQVIDRAATLLEDVRVASAIRVDDVSVGLLDARFELQRVDGSHRLLGPRVELAARRTLLGKATPCLGRNKELALLDATLDECLDESVARAVLVTAGAGVGKSRVARELLLRARERAKPPEVWVATGDSLATGSALALVRQLVRQATGLRDGQPRAEQRRRLHQAVSDLLAPKLRGHAEDFLGELAGLDPVDQPCPAFRAARNDPRLMKQHTERAFAKWLGARVARWPQLLVLEDLHWGDRPSCDYVAQALRQLAERPVMVVGLGRPEIHQLFPELWSGVDVQEVRLGPLTRHAARRLARGALAGRATDETIDRVVELAGGNAFFLEELIRRVAEADTAELPETVLAMVQSRLDTVEPEARRILRAASVFGSRFWRQGVAALLGTERDLDRWLETLQDREWLEPAEEGRFEAATELTFRHSLVREAAYSTLPESDRVTAHRRAAQWLVEIGETDPLVLAEHLERGGEPACAVPHLARAAEAAYGTGTLDDALALAARGIDAGAAGPSLGSLLATQAAAHGWRAEFHESLACAKQALALLPSGSVDWFRCAGGVVFAGNVTGNFASTAQVIQSMGELSVEPDATGPYASASMVLIMGLLHAGQRELALQFVDRLEAVARAQPEPDHAFAGWLHAARVLPQIFLLEDLGAALANARQASALLEQAGDTIGRTYGMVLVGMVETELGLTDEALGSLRCALKYAEQGRVSVTASLARTFLVRALGAAGRIEEALVIATELLDVADPFSEMVVQAIQAGVLVRADRIDEAREAARRVLDRGLPMLLMPRLAALVALAEIALADGEPRQALEFADQALAIKEAGVGGPNLGALARLARASALHALGELEQAREAVAEAAQAIERVAATVEEPVARDSYRKMAAHEQTLALARELLVGDDRQD